MSYQGDFRYPALERVSFGVGSLAALGPSLERAAVDRVLLITSNSLAHQTNLVPRVESEVGSRLAGTFSEPKPHVPRDVVFQVAEQARTLAADGIVSFGGGSVSDLGKAVALVLAEGLTRGSQLDQYRVTFDARSVTAPALTSGAVLPHWALATTLSAGEFTSGLGITDPKRGLKDVFGDPRLMIRHVILDSELTLATPSELWLSTGIRAVDHCVECWCSGVFQPFSLALHKDALARLVQYLPACAADPDDLDARTHCQIAAWEAGYGIANMGLGMSHGIGHQLGARFNIPHGITSCVVLPAVMEYNRAVREAELAEIAAVLGVDRALGVEAMAIQAPARLREFISELRLPVRLSQIGISREDLSQIASDALQDISVVRNPRPVRGTADVMTVLEAAF